METPFTFATLIGQDKAKRLLRQAVANDRVSHAYLFQGPAGVGKKRAAHTLAAWLNCRQATADDACGRCSSCRRMATASHPDWLVIAPEKGRLKIDQVRGLKKKLSFPPFEGGIRAVLLADIQHLGVEAANSLLKTLEEPPEHTILILTVDEGARVLDTIVSRCQVISFTSLPTEQLSDYLQRQHQLPPETAATVAAVSGGSIGKSRLLLEHDLLGLRAELTEAIDRFAADDPAAVQTFFALAAKAAALQDQLPELLSLLRLWLRDRLLALTGNPDRIVNQDIREKIIAPAKPWQAEDIFKRLSLVDLAARQLLFNCSRPTVCESLFFALL